MSHHDHHHHQGKKKRKRQNHLVASSNSVSPRTSATTKKQHQQQHDIRSAPPNTAVVVTNPHKEKWNMHDYPYTADYCDHFETPLQAYQDIAPIVDALFFPKKQRSQIVLYDPYYCNGRTKILLQEKLGYQQVIHEKRDFYKDIQNKTVPCHDILVTNPPFSDQHKQQCLNFCLHQLRTENRPFCILMPLYVAAREYYKRAALQQQQQQQQDVVIYLIPSQRYQYDHPQGTGKIESPFESLWFIGTSKNEEQLLLLLNNKKNAGVLCELVTSWKSLSKRFSLEQKRPNPRQRRRKRQNTMVQSLSSSSVDHNTSNQLRQHKKKEPPISTNEKNKMSKYRNEQGKRTKRRF